MGIGEGEEERATWHIRGYVGEEAYLHICRAYFWEFESIKAYIFLIHSGHKVPLPSNNSLIYWYFVMYLQKYSLICSVGNNKSVVC